MTARKGLLRGAVYFHSPSPAALFYLELRHDRTKLPPPLPPSSGAPILPKLQNIPSLLGLGDGGGVEEELWSAANSGPSFPSPGSGEKQTGRARRMGPGEGPGASLSERSSSSLTGGARHLPAGEGREVWAPQGLPACRELCGEAEALDWRLQESRAGKAVSSAEWASSAQGLLSRRRNPSEGG